LLGFNEIHVRLILIDKRISVMCNTRGDSLLEHDSALSQGVEHMVQATVRVVHGGTDPAATHQREEMKWPGVAESDSPTPKGGRNASCRQSTARFVETEYPRHGQGLPARRCSAGSQRCAGEIGANHTGRRIGRGRAHSGSPLRPYTQPAWSTSALDAVVRRGHAPAACTVRRSLLI
jgi:hypothetical protein